MELSTSFAMTKICSLNGEDMSDGDVLDGAVAVLEDVTLREVGRPVDIALDTGRDEGLEVGPVDGRNVGVVRPEDPDPDGKRDGAE